MESSFLKDNPYFLKPLGKYESQDDDGHCLYIIYDKMQTSLKQVILERAKTEDYFSST